MDKYPRSEERTGFKTKKKYSPDIDIQTDFVILNELSDDIAQRASSWKEKGYIVHLTTGISQGNFKEYLDGKYDGITHWNEAQTDENGQILMHSIGNPFMVPTLPFTKYIIEKLKKAIDAGIFDIHAEEPEFLIKSGYSEAFKREWEIFYRKPWEDPMSSVSAQYKASKLKAALLTRAINTIGSELKFYAKARYNKDLRFYVSTHSIMNYSSLGIISPESSIMNINSTDGCIAQIWTGTSRIPNMYNGEIKERTLLTSFLEYGYMQELARNSGKKMWFMHDPIEDTVSYGWDDYRYNYTRTLIASLYHTEIHDYEVCPWVDRVINGSYPRNTVFEAKPIPEKYKTTLLTVMNLLRNMAQDDIKWETANSPVGVLISDTALYQKIYPKDDAFGKANADSIAHFSGFYGLAVPLLERGIPVLPVPMENITRFANYLNKYKIILMSYEFMKPADPTAHYLLHEWVKKGGVIIYVGDNADSFHNVEEWWNTGDCNYDTPADHLIEVFGLTSKIKTLKKKSNQTSRILLDCIYNVGKGQFAFFNEAPFNCAREADYAHFLRKLVYAASEKSGNPVKVSKSMILNRGPYKIVAVMDDDNKENVALNGHFADLLTHDYEVETFIVAEPGSIYLLYDLDTITDEIPKLIAVSGRSENTVATETSFSMTVKAPARTECACRIYCPFDAELRVNGKKTEFVRDETNKTLFFRFQSGNAVKIELNKICSKK